MNTKSDINALELSTPEDEALSGSQFAGRKRERPWKVWPRLRQNQRAGNSPSIVSKIIYRLDRIFGDLVAITLGLAIAALWLTTTVLDKQSSDFSVLRPNFKMWFAEAFDGRDAEFGDLEFVQIEDAKVYVKNAVSGVDLKSDVELLRANISDDGHLIVAVNGTVDQSSAPMPFTLNTVSDAAFDTVKIRIDVTGARLDEVAPTKGRFWELQGLEAPVDLSADFDFFREEGLRSASVDVKVGAGQFTLLRELKPRSYPLQNLTLRASLEPGNRRMDIDKLDLKAPNLSFQSSGFLTQLENMNDGDENSSPVFNLSFRNLRANMTPFFPEETKIKGLNIIGQADVDSRSLTLSSGQLEVFDTVHEFDGALVLQSNNAVKSVKLNTNMTGVLKPDQFMSLWPVKSFEGARAWVDGAVIDSDITKLETKIDFDEAFFETPILTEDRLMFRFGGQNTSVRYLQSLPPATGVSGTGEILGNRLSLSLNGGQVDAINLTSGSVEIPKLRPKNGDIIVNMNGEGAVSEFMRLGDFPPFKIASRYNVDPATLAGQGTASVTVQRALTPYLPREEIDYQIIGNFTGANAPFDLGRYKITNGMVSLDANKERVVMKGPVNIGPWRADMRWLETFGETAPLTEYGVSGIVDADTRNINGTALQRE